MRTGIVALACAGVLLVGCAGGDGTDTGDTADTSDTGIDPTAQDEVAFQAALALYDAGSYAEALAAFRAFLGDFPDSPRVDNAEFLIGRCQFELLDFAAAWQTFVDFLATFPTSPFADDALYYKGRAEFEQALFTAAAGTFGTLVTTFPTSPFVDNANYYAGRSLFETGDLVGAVARFDLVIAVSGRSYRDGALYWAGRASLDRFEASATSGADAAADGYFETLFADYPADTYVDNARFYYGMVAYRRADDAGARTRWDVLRTDFPNSLYRDETSYYYGLTWFHQSAYVAADDEFEAFIGSSDAEFTSSVYRDNATYFAGRSNYLHAPSAAVPATEYAEAIGHFSALLTTYATSGYADNSLFFRGESHYERAVAGVDAVGEYAAAAADFDAMIATYDPTTSPYLDDAYYYRVRVAVDNGDCTKSATTLDAFAVDYPSGTHPLYLQAVTYDANACP